MEHNRFLPDDNLSYPVLVKIKNKCAASGFYYNYKNTELFFITAKHVLFLGNKLRDRYVNLVSYPGDISVRKNIELRVDLEKNKNNIHPHKNKDVVVIKIADLIKNEEGEGFKAYYLKDEGVSVIKWPRGVGMLWFGPESIKKFNETLISNEVFIFGYPSSLGDKQIKQIDYERPLLRKGIIAGFNYKNETIILDCPAYFGNSGGPAIEVDEIKGSVGQRSFLLIGIVSQYIPFVEEFVSLQNKFKNISVANSGYSVVTPVDAIFEVIDNIKRPG